MDVDVEFAMIFRRSIVFSKLFSKKVDSGKSSEIGNKIFDAVMIKNSFEICKFQ